MSIPETFIKRKDKKLSDFGFTKNELFVRISREDTVKIYVDKIFEVSFVDNGNKSDGYFTEFSFDKEVITDSNFMYKLKRKLGLKINKEIQKIKIEGSLFMQGSYFPQNYIDVEYLFEDIIDIDKAKILPDDITKILKKDYFKTKEL